MFVINKRVPVNGYPLLLQIVIAETPKHHDIPSYNTTTQLFYQLQRHATSMEFWHPRQRTLTTHIHSFTIKIPTTKQHTTDHAALTVGAPPSLSPFPHLTLFALSPTCFASHSLPNSFKPIKPHLSNFFRSHTNLQVSTDLPHIAFTFSSTTSIWLQIFTFPMPLYFLMTSCNFIILSDNQHFHYLCPDWFSSKRSQPH